MRYAALELNVICVCEYVVNQTSCLIDMGDNDDVQLRVWCGVVLCDVVWCDVYYNLWCDAIERVEVVWCCCCEVCIVIQTTRVYYKLRKMKEDFNGYL